MLITHTPNDVTEFFVDFFNEVKDQNIEHGLEHYQNALTQRSWWSGDLTKFICRDNLFVEKNCNFVKNITEKLFHKRLDFRFFHLINYTPGGSMEYHSHEHNEDYVAILYLNNCTDGETNFYLQDIVSITPKKGQIAIFESHIKHSGSFATDKQVAVFGFKIYED